MNWQDHVSVDPTICHGQACIRGTRIPVAVVLANLAAGHTPDEIRRSYPGLGDDAVPAALAYAAELASERVLTLPPAPRAAWPVTAPGAALRFKLDENVPTEAAALRAVSGYECHSVYEEALAGAPDATIAVACAREGRVLVTLDLDFSDVRAYPPGSHPGIMELRPRAPDRAATLALLARVLPLLGHEPLTGCPWIVDGERVRVRTPHHPGS